MLTLKLLKLSVVDAPLAHLRDEFDSHDWLGFVSQWGVNQQMHQYHGFLSETPAASQQIQGHVSTLLFLIDIKDPSKWEIEAEPKQ